MKLAEKNKSPDARSFDDAIRPILAANCVSCHSGDKPKGDLRLDQLKPDFADEATRETWLRIAERVTAGEMPPKAKPRPAEKDVQTLSAWINGQAQIALAARRARQGRIVLRRLNRTEYENTVRDLLGVDVDLKDMLPLDSSANGFDNVGSCAAHFVVPDGKISRSGQHRARRGDRQQAPAEDDRFESDTSERPASDSQCAGKSFSQGGQRGRAVHFVALGCVQRLRFLADGSRPLSFPRLGIDDSKRRSR